MSASVREGIDWVGYVDWDIRDFHSYSTTRGSTAKMAHAIAESACIDGVETKLIHVRRTDLTRIAADVLDAAAIAFGSATLNNGMMPMAGAALTYLKGLKPAAKAAVAFGSYGWGRGGAGDVNRMLQTLTCELVGEPLEAQFAPSPAMLEKCRGVGRLLGEKARAAADPMHERRRESRPCA